MAPLPAPTSSPRQSNIRQIMLKLLQIKTIGGMRKSRFVGRAKTDWAFTFAAAAYNLVRLPRLLEAA